MFISLIADCGHSSGDSVRVSGYKPLGCGFESYSYLYLWDVFLGVPLSAICPRRDQNLEAKQLKSTYCWLQF